MSDLSPLSGVEQKSHFGAGRSAFDHKGLCVKAASYMFMWRFLRPHIIAISGITFEPAKKFVQSFMSARRFSSFCPRW